MLNSMKMGFYLAKRSATGPLPERWDELSQTYAEVERLFDLIQSIYRTMALTLVRQPFRAIVEERGRTWIAAFEREGLTLKIEPPDREAPGEFDAMRLSSALDAFVTWRASRLRPGGTAVLSWSTTGRSFQVRWKETPGTDPEVGADSADPTSPYAAAADATRMA